MSHKQRKGHETTTASLHAMFDHIFIYCTRLDAHRGTHIAILRACTMPDTAAGLLETQYSCLHAEASSARTLAAAVTPAR